MFLLANMAAPAATGDNANILLYVVLGLVAAVVVVLLTFKDKILKKTGADEKKQEAAGQQWEKPDSVSNRAEASTDDSAKDSAEDSGDETKEQPEDKQ